MVVNVVKTLGKLAVIVLLFGATAYISGCDWSDSHKVHEFNE